MVEPGTELSMLERLCWADLALCGQRDAVPEGRSSAFTTLISTFFLLRLSSLSAP